MRSILCTPCSCSSTSFSAKRVPICILRDVQKEYPPICTEKDSFVTSGPQTRTSSKNFLLGRRFSASHFLRTSSTSPSLYSVYLYTQMIAIQRTSASLIGATTTGARSSPATSRKNHRAAAASTVTRRDGMRSHVTSMERRTKNSFRLPAIAMPSPEVNEQMMQTMTYNETGKWRENFDLAGWAKEIREVRFSSLEFKRRPFPPVVIRMWIVFVLKALSSALSPIAASFHRF